MNLRYKVLGFVAAIGMAVGIAAPALAQSDESNTGDNTQSLTVTLTESGIFNVKFEYVSTSFFSGAQTAASPERHRTASIYVQYVDTMSYRPFNAVTSLNADDFVSGSDSIDNSNLKILENHNPQQGRWSHGYADASGDSSQQWINLVGPIGDIGATNAGNFSNDPVNGYNGCSTGNTGLGYVDGPGDAAYFNWADPYGVTTGVGQSDPTNSFANSNVISCARVGGGTAGVSYDANGVNTGGPTYGTLQRILMELTIPAGQHAGSYTTTLTATVNTADI